MDEAKELVRLCPAGRLYEIENTALSPDILIVFIVANDCDLTVGRKIVRNGRLMF
jgi:hypothetical protein